jgi:hypothetical protein
VTVDICLILLFGRKVTWNDNLNIESINQFKICRLMIPIWDFLCYSWCSNFPFENFAFDPFSENSIFDDSWKFQTRKFLEVCL